MVWIQCDVTVRVDGAPMTLDAFSDFELKDAAGNVYQMDILAALASIQNVQLSPSRRCPPVRPRPARCCSRCPRRRRQRPVGADGEAGQPAGDGGQPGTIVISGDLHPFSAAGQ